MILIIDLIVFIVIIILPYTTWTLLYGIIQYETTVHITFFQMDVSLLFCLFGVH